MNVGANMVGNHVRWVIVLNAVGLIEFLTPDGSMLNMAFIGLMPRSAPKLHLLVAVWKILRQAVVLQH